MLPNSCTARVARRLAAVAVAVSLADLLVPMRASADLGDCSQPATGGPRPAASDCLFILNVAVDLLTCTPECICAPKGSLPVMATDALVCLQVVVGQPVELNCPCSGTTTTTTLPTGSTTTLTVAPTTTTSTSTTSTTLLQCPVQVLTPPPSGGQASGASANAGLVLACGCVSDSGPACNGACPGEGACVPDFDTQECFCQQFGCGDYMSGPQCYGLCATGEICVDLVIGCDCVTVSNAPCASAGSPECDGECPDGQFCHQAGEGCACVDVTCGHFAAAPLCLGTCPTGQVCVDFGGSCGCAAD